LLWWTKDGVGVTAQLCLCLSALVPQSIAPERTYTFKRDREYLTVSSRFFSSSMHLLRGLSAGGGA
jgi:hypothetical protein